MERSLRRCCIAGAATLHRIRRSASRIHIESDRWGDGLLFDGKALSIKRIALEPHTRWVSFAALRWPCDFSHTSYPDKAGKSLPSPRILKGMAFRDTPSCHVRLSMLWGCASVSVQEVPSEMFCSEWHDVEQKAAIAERCLMHRGSSLFKEDKNVRLGGC